MLVGVRGLWAVLFKCNAPPHPQVIPPDMVPPSHPQLLDGAIVPDGVAGLEANPLRNRPVLLLRLGELLLRAERLVGLYDPSVSHSRFHHPVFMRTGILTVSQCLLWRCCSVVAGCVVAVAVPDLQIRESPVRSAGCSAGLGRAAKTSKNSEFDRCFRAIAHFTSNYARGMEKRALPHASSGPYTEPHKRLPGCQSSVFAILRDSASHAIRYTTAGSHELQVSNPSLLSLHLADLISLSHNVSLHPLSPTAIPVTSRLLQSPLNITSRPMQIQHTMVLSTY